MRLAEIAIAEQTIDIDDLTPDEILSLEPADDDNDGDVDADDVEDFLAFIDDIIRQAKTGKEDVDEAKGTLKLGRKVFVVRKGKKVKVNIRRRAGTISPKQRIALKRARRKAQLSPAKRKRARSIKVRKRMGVKRVKGGARRGFLARNR